jgi:glycosyltransferase involved in cell wall biosynthesis
VDFLGGEVDTVTVVMPHIPPRQFELTRAIASVAAQTKHPDDVIIATDRHGAGSAATRNRALYHVSTTWVAFLDDDDELLPSHIEILVRAAMRSGVGVVYSGCRVLDAKGDPIPVKEEWGRFGLPFDGDLLQRKAYLPVTSIVHASLAKQALFGPPAFMPSSDYDDWGFYVRLLALGATFLHVPEITWIWHHHGSNTSGRSDRW